MNDTAPRCAGPGTSCRLLQLETPGARPVWAVLDAAGLRRFTGEITLASRPVVRAYFNDGEVYYAEREGDPTIGQRLMEYGVVTHDELIAGTVQLGKVGHLGRLFDRVPSLERDAVELVLELVTGEVLGEIADHTVEHISIASYRHHSSGVSKWRRRATQANAGVDELLTGEIAVVPAATIPVDSFFAPPAAPPLPHPVVDHTDLRPTAEDHALVAEYEQMMSHAALDLAPIDEPTTEPVPETASEIEIEIEATTEIEAETDTAIDVIEPVFQFEPVSYDQAGDQPGEEPGEEPPPFSFGFDLNKVLAQVVMENDGIPMGDEDVADDVRAAVREALAEIEAATRPTPTQGLSATAFEIALDTSPETAADIEPVVPPGPYLPVRALGTPTGNQPAVSDETSVSEPVPASDTPSTGLRRLIGGSRKP
jgi:hypothetical protein